MRYLLIVFYILIKDFNSFFYFLTILLKLVVLLDYFKNNKQ